MSAGLFLALLGGVLYLGAGNSVQRTSLWNECKNYREWIHEDRQFLKECATLLNESPILEFLTFAKEMLSEDQHKNILGDAIYHYFREHPERRSFFQTYIHDIESYAHPAAQWSALTYDERIEDLLKQFQAHSDFSILSYQLEFHGGLKRGVWNTYVDIASNAFQPVSGQNNPLLQTPGLFDDNNEAHQKLYYMVQAFSAFTHLKGILSRVFETLDQLGPTSRLDADDHEADELYVKLHVLYELYFEAAKQCSISIDALKNSLQSQARDWETSVEELQRIL